MTTRPEPEATIPATARPGTEHPEDARLGELVAGKYKLLGVLGEGGFGVVYEAEQERPMRRRLALKVLKPGMDSKAVIARFEAERQALAVMDHPNIARVLDGGVTASGHPYFVMELVKGEPITAFCDKHKLGIRERVALFRRVCEAIQHAHAKGVIHRDLKPSNILVEYRGDRGVPKVIDFGVAKAIDQRLSEHTIFTQQGQLIGTPQYMSPEQAEMSALDIDTRTDVYSLGVVLYELLTGMTPFDAETLRRAAFHEIQRIIRDVAPPKPSTRLGALSATDEDGAMRSRIASSRRVREGELASTLRQDLDWIVLRCLEKERERRYATPLALEDDLRRFLEHQSVVARPPSSVYRAQKFAKRHWKALTVSGAAFLLLTGSLVVTTTLLRRAVEAEHLASSRLEASREHAKLLVTEFGDAWARGGAADSLPRVRAMWDWCKTTLAKNDPITLRTGDRVTVALGYAGEHDEMLAVAMENYALRDDVDDVRARVWAASHLHWAYRVAALALPSEKAAKRERYFRESIRIGRETLDESVDAFGETDSDSCVFAAQLGEAMLYAGRREGAAALIDRWAPIIERTESAPHIACRCHQIAGEVYAGVGRLEDAERHFERAIGFIGDDLAVNHVDAQWGLRRAINAYESWASEHNLSRYRERADALRGRITLWESW